MRRLRLLIVSATLMVALFVGSGVASAGVAWCEIGSPPPMDTTVSGGGTLAPNPQNNPHGMPTPLFKNANGKFSDNNIAVTSSGSQLYLPPGMAKAASGK